MNNFPKPLLKGFTVYGANYCEYCQKAKSWCYENNVTFLYVNIYDFINENEKDKLFSYFGDIISNHKTIPIIFCDDKFIGGWTDMSNFVKEKRKLEILSDF